MAPKTRRQLGILGVLLLILLLAIVYNRDAEPVIATTATPLRAQSTARAPHGLEVDAVRLDALARTRPEPEAGARNPFRFRAAAPPAPTEPSSASRPGPGQASTAAPAGPVVPTGPPPPPPIALKFIGVVEQAPSHLKLAVLSDGRNVFYGKEGDTIEGRYRIERIGVESIEMAYVDGRGRQTLRLSGS